MAVSAIEPLGVEVNKSGQLYSLFATNKPKFWESLKMNQCFLVLVVQYFAQVGYVQYRGLLGR
jgi:hypothetical protein